MAKPKVNPVAKLCGKFNRAVTHVDRKKALVRGARKHKGQDYSKKAA